MCLVVTDKFIDNTAASTFNLLFLFRFSSYPFRFVNRVPVTAGRTYAWSSIPLAFLDCGTQLSIPCFQLYQYSMVEPYESYVLKHSLSNLFA